MTAPGLTSPRRAAVVGHPVAHSLSPLLHGTAYAALGLDGWRYDRLDVLPEDLPALLASLDDGWAGLSVTMPHKHALLDLVDHVDPLARVVGAANTVLLQPGRTRPQLVALNTDVHGLVTALAEGLGTADRADGRRGVVLGGGATAASALAGLAQLGVTEADVVVRSPGRAGALLRAAERMGLHPHLRAWSTATDLLPAADVVVSTLPAHGADELAQALAAAAVPCRGVLLDCAYDPRPTALGTAWSAVGGTAVGGERMLLHQAVEQVRLMTGRPAPLAVMDDALTRHLVGTGA
ncbi:shikimate dehydrogenase [Cellulomonas marina]|uniref:Shikimate dehydrogenase n=1 Tax=Cellulomonas marina TaxID=988821 RepID=A0A1I0W995_9CELL|nr:shikimate dehydrogenase [Cellulomonas marina]GIG29137.1 shikimate 5-dehydrogenase [Cellulomonas marina]SFA84486.1 shikimate dehydrogenase [Cellulomonas marina]